MAIRIRRNDVGEEMLTEINGRIAHLMPKVLFVFDKLGIRENRQLAFLAVTLWR